MVGFVFCRRFKSIPITELLPVVMVSALDDASERV
jgi:DNA-binding response OmpR family regulator